MTQPATTPPHQVQPPPGHARLVDVTIDGDTRLITADTYPVLTLKGLLGVPAEYELELVKGGKFHPLTDTETYKVHGHEEFLSHVRCGGSS